jgi:hypothetical protein
MVDATISRVRMRDLARRGRFHVQGSRFAASLNVCASRPGEGDLVASTI